MGASNAVLMEYINYTGNFDLVLFVKITAINYLLLKDFRGIIGVAPIAMSS